MSEIKHCFVSRFPEGVILEADFSQLEVIGLAALSKDPMLIQDLLEGRDMHRYFAAQLYGCKEEEVTKPQRTLTKRFTFQLQYGGGAAGLAKKNGVTKDVAERFIEAYYGRYQVVKAWQDRVMDTVKASAVSCGRTTPSGANSRMGVYDSVTGRRYVFFEQDPPEQFKDRTPNFNPPETKNYPVQGFATGDIMAIFRATVFRDLLTAGMLNTALPINTVHDSVMFDCYNRDVGMELKDILEEAANALPGILEATWGIETPVPFRIETSIGPSWGEQEKV
jgi:DNA polymerase I